MNLLDRRKTVEQARAAGDVERSGLKRDITTSQLVLLGIAFTIGAGIFVLTGIVADNQAGPGVVVSFAVVAVLCIPFALCYAEFASMAPVAGSAYSYAFVTLGEFTAFILGWDLILEYSITASTVLSGAGGYLNNLLTTYLGFHLPAAVIDAPGAGGVVNLPALIAAVLVIGVVLLGIRSSKRVMIALVIGTLITVVVVVAAGIPHIKASNYHPFLPFGFSGVAAGGAVVMFAFVGFDALSSLAEEVKNPQRSMSRGIIGSLIAVGLIYVVFSAVVVGLVKYTSLGTAAPVADAFAALHMPIVEFIVDIGALVTLLHTAMAFILGQSRIGYAMSRDAMLPKALGKISEKRKTPTRMVLLMGGLVVLLSSFTPIEALANMANIGTLFAFASVAAGILYLRKKRPDVERPFRTPWVPFIPIVAIIAAIALVAKLDWLTWVRFAVWLAIGQVVYWRYSRKRSPFSKGDSIPLRAVSRGD